MNPITRECQDCQDLEEVLSYIDCTLLALSQEFYNSVVYGVKTCCNDGLYQSLLAYKRIITARTHNSHYPCYEYSSNEILGKARLLAYKTNCSRCPECEEVLTTTTTTTFPPGACVTVLVRLIDTTITSGSYPYSYINCEGEIVTGNLAYNSFLNVCIIDNSFVISPIFSIVKYDEGCNLLPGGTCACTRLTNTETESGVVAYKYSYHDCDGGVFTDVLLDFGDSVDICLNPNTLTTNFAHTLQYSAPCIDSCD